MIWECAPWSCACCHAEAATGSRGRPAADAGHGPVCPHRAAVAHTPAFAQRATCRWWVLLHLADRLQCLCGPCAACTATVTPVAFTALSVKGHDDVSIQLRDLLACCCMQLATAYPFGSVWLKRNCSSLWHGHVQGNYGTQVRQGLVSQQRQYSSTAQPLPISHAGGLRAACHMGTGHRIGHRTLCCAWQADLLHTLGMLKGAGQCCRAASCSAILMA